MSNRGQSLVLFAVILLAGIIAYGMYVQATGHGDFFGNLFNSANDLCATLGQMKDTAGNCVTR